MSQGVFLMSEQALCARCGKMSELCQSGRSNGLKQPRLCKSCVAYCMKTDDWEIDREFWITQMVQLGDTESLDHLKLSLQI